MPISSGRYRPWSPCAAAIRCSATANRGRGPRRPDKSAATVRFFGLGGEPLTAKNWSSPDHVAFGFQLDPPAKAAEDGLLVLVNGGREAVNFRLPLAAAGRRVTLLLYSAWPATPNSSAIGLADWTVEGLAMAIFAVGRPPAGKRGGRADARGAREPSLLVPAGARSDHPLPVDRKLRCRHLPADARAGLAPLRLHLLPPGLRFLRRVPQPAGGGARRSRPTAPCGAPSRKNADLEIFLGPPALSLEHLDLFERYHAARSRQRGWRARETTPHDYFLSFVDGAHDFGAELQLRLHDRLVAVALVDILPRGISAIYCYYDPELKERGLGTMAILTELQIAKRRGDSPAFPRLLGRAQCQYALQGPLRSARDPGRPARPTARRPLWEPAGNFPERKKS